MLGNIFLGLSVIYDIIYLLTYGDDKMVFGILLAIFLGGGVYSVWHFFVGVYIVLSVMIAIAIIAILLLATVYQSYEPTS